MRGKTIPASGPHNVSKTAWYYIERTKLCYVQEERKDGQWKRKDGRWIRTHEVQIPWRVLKAIMAKVKP